MAKEVKKSTLHSTSKKKVFTSIYNSIKDYNKLPDTRYLQMTKQSLNYYINKLKLDSIIKKIGYGTWVINKEVDITKYILEIKEVKKSTLLASTSNTKKRIRTHGFIITFDIPKIKNWENRSKYLDTKNIQYKQLTQNKGQRIIIDGFKVWLCNKSIVIYMPKHKSYFSETAADGYKYAIYDLLNKLKRIENMFNLSFKIKGNYKFRIGRQHYAHIKNKLAEQYNNEGKKLFIYQDGKCWLIADKSYTNELETTDNTKAQKDMDETIQPFFNSIRGKKGFTADFILESFNNLIEDRKYYAENLKSHVSAIQELGSAVKKLTETVGKIDKKN